MKKQIFCFIIVYIFFIIFINNDFLQTQNCSRFFPRGDQAPKPPRKAAQAIVASASMLGLAPRGRYVLRFQSFHLACCPRRAQIGTWFLGVLMFHCSRPVLLPSPSYACVPSRPARLRSRHVRSMRRRLELVHPNTWVFTSCHHRDTISTPRCKHWCQIASASRSA